MSESDEERGCSVKGCPWMGPPDECPFTHYEQDNGNTFLDRLMRQRPHD